MNTISQKAILDPSDHQLWEKIDKAVKCYEWPPENMMTTIERRLVLALAFKYDHGYNKVEIGTYNGFTTFVLSRGFPGRKIHTVDLIPSVEHPEQPGVHLGHHYKSNNCTNVVQHLRKGTEEIWKDFGPFDFVLIDGDHEVQSVRGDFLCAASYLGLSYWSKGGIIIMDDCFMEGPAKVIVEDDFIWGNIEGTKLAFTLI